MSREVRNDPPRAIDILGRARAPSILIGPGARGAIDLIAELACRLGAPVLTTPDAKSMFDETSAYAAGVFSFGATDLAQAIARESDTVVAVGTNLGEFATQGGRAFEGADIIHVTDDPLELSIGRVTAVAIAGEISATIGLLVSGARRMDARFRWFERLRAPDPALAVAERPKPGAIDPGHAIRALGKALPSQVRVACDVTSAALHLLRDLRLTTEQRVWLQIEKSACMGSALAAGLGVRLASDIPTLVVIGDWGLLMGGSELHTVATLGVGRFVVVVWSNSGGALIRAGVSAQRIAVPAETHSWVGPRFADVARAHDIRGLTARTATGLGRAAAAAFRAPFPVLIEATIAPNAEIPGAGARYVHLETSRHGHES